MENYCANKQSMYLVYNADIHPDNFIGMLRNKAILLSSYKSSLQESYKRVSDVTANFFLYSFFIL